MLISIILVSLIAIGTVSAADNATDVMKISDVDEPNVISVDSVDDAKTIEDNSKGKEIQAINDLSEVLSENNDSIEFDISVNDTPYDEDVNVEISVINANSSTNYNDTQVNFMVDGALIGNTTLDTAGKGTFIIPAYKYEVGSYYIMASAGSFDNAINGALFKITKTNPIINVEDVTVTYGDVVTIPFNVTDSKGKGISGDVIITICWQEDSLSKYVKITNGTAKASFNLADLIGIFGGNSTFDIGSLFNGTNGTFNISSLFGENGTFTIGNSTIDISSLLNGTTNITLGNSTFDIGSLMNGTFSLGNSTFDIGGIFNGTTPITIGNTTLDFSSLFNKKDTTDTDEKLGIAAESDDKISANNTFDFGSLFGGNSTFKIGNSTFDISSLLNGTFSIGNSTFDIGSLLNGTTNISIGNTTLDLGGLFNGTGNGTFDISSILDMLMGKGDNTLAYAFPPGTYNITVTYLSSRNYNEAANDTAKLHIIPKENVVFTIDVIPPKKYGDKTYVDIALKDGYGNPISNGTVNVIFNGEDKGNITVDENGTYELVFNKLANGTYELVLAHNGTNNTFAIIVDIPVTTKITAKAMTTVTVNTAVDGKIGKYFSFTLKDSLGNALSKKKVQIAFNGKKYSVNTNSNGIAKLQINVAKAGTYTISACYLGDADYDASFAVSTITVKKQAPKLAAKKTTYKAKAKTKLLKATLKSAKGNAIKGKKITFKIKNKTYTAKTNKKGVASVKVKLAKKGKYPVVVKFAGDNTYKAISKKIQLILK